MCIVYGFVYMCVCVCHCVSTFRMVDVSLQVYLHVYLITQVRILEHRSSFLLYIVNSKKQASNAHSMHIVPCWTSKQGY